MLAELQKTEAEATPRQRIDRLQAEAAKLPQLSLPTSHLFADGMYCRVLPRPAGATIVGKVHKREHFYICAAGLVEVFSEDGSRRTLGAGDVVVSKPGTKRTVFALVDSVCMTVHRTDSTDLDEIGRELTEPDETALFDARNEPLKVLR